RYSGSYRFFAGWSAVSRPQHLRPPRLRIRARVFRALHDPARQPTRIVILRTARQVQRGAAAHAHITAAALRGRHDRTAVGAAAAGGPTAYPARTSSTPPRPPG